jgi:phytoene synthase
MKRFSDPLSASFFMLDHSLTNQAAPPGSMRYFSLLYTPEARRESVTALYAIDAEIRESARSANHEVAHSRLQWWRAEVDRLVNGAAQHPATRALQADSAERAELAKLHEVIAAADMDLARMTYDDARELRAYCSRSAGAAVELVAAQLIRPLPLTEPLRSYANRVGVGVRQTEIIRDLRQDAYDGLLYVPLDRMDAHGLTTSDLRAREIDPRARSVLQELHDSARQNLEAAPPDRALRPIAVLAALHRRLLDRIAACNYDVGGERVELGPFEKPWVAWRAARLTQKRIADSG